MLELFNAAPGILTLIAILLLALLGSGVYGLLHSSYSRRLVVGAAVIVTGLALGLLILARIVSHWWPRPVL